MNRMIHTRISTRRPRICIVSHDGFGAFTGGRTGRAGGVEWQTGLLARHLAGRSYPVSLLTWDDGQGEECCIDDVRVIGLCRRRDGLPGLRFFHPRWTALNRGLRQADADVYYHNCAEAITGQVAFWCRLHGRRFVYSAASDPDCDARLPHLPSIRERILYRYGLRKADRIIVQTQQQQRMLREGFGLPSVVLALPCPGPRDGHYVQPLLPTASPRAAWVGRIVEVKRLEWMLAIAAAMPEVIFHVAGSFEEQRPYVQDLHRRALALPNVRLHGRVTREQMPGFYRQAHCLLCTSVQEGFPNAFLEAWSHGLPVVSTVDPDGLIAARGLGAVADDTQGLLRQLRALLRSPDRWRHASCAARRYYMDHHTPEKAMPRFEQLFVDLVRHRMGET